MHRVRTLLADPHFRTGWRDMSAVGLGIGAWGLVTGVAMVNSGIPVSLALLMTMTVYAGSAQLAALPLITSGAPMWVVWATAFCVNLRFVIFSAQWRPFFLRFRLRDRLLLGYLSSDLAYVLFMKRYQEPQLGAGQVEYFLGGTTVNWLAWQVPAVIGILLADIIPTEWGLGFAGVLALLGLFFSLLSDRATALAAVVAGTAAVAAFALPFKLHLVVAIAAAVCVGLMIDGGGDAGRRLRQAMSRPRPKGDGPDAPQGGAP